MKENREEYKAKITKEITKELNLESNKLYCIEEINELLTNHKFDGGVLQFTPTKSHTADQIINTLVLLDMKITDGFDKEFGIYEDKSKCDYCGNYFAGNKMFQICTIENSPFLCEECRRKNKIKIGRYDFMNRFSEEERKQFVFEEVKHGLDYSDYIDKMKHWNEL